VFLPIIHIDFCNTTNQQFKLTFIKDVDKILGNQLVESFLEGFELFFDTLGNTPFGDKTGKTKYRMNPLLLLPF
jgi:hypothetical protein